MEKRAKVPEFAGLERDNFKFELQLFAEDSPEINEPADGIVDDNSLIENDEGHELNIGEKQALFDGSIAKPDGEEEPETLEEPTAEGLPDAVKREQSSEANTAFAEMRRKAEQAEQELKARDAWAKQNFSSQGLETWEQYQAAIEEGQRRETLARQQQMQQRPQQVYQQTYQELIELGYDQQVAHRLAKNEADNAAYALKVQAMEEKLTTIENQEKQKTEQQEQEAMIKQVLNDHQYLKGKYGDLVPDIETLDEKTVALMNQGIPLKAAWLAANEDAIVDFARGKGAQKAVREINSKAHLDSEKGGGSGIGKQVHISDEKLNVWRTLGYSDKEARQKEARYQRQKRG